MTAANKTKASFPPRVDLAGFLAGFNEPLPAGANEIAPVLLRLPRARPGRRS